VKNRQRELEKNMEKFVKAEALVWISGTHSMCCAVHWMMVKSKKLLQHASLLLFFFFLFYYF